VVTAQYDLQGKTNNFKQGKAVLILMARGALILRGMRASTKARGVMIVLVGFSALCIKGMKYMYVYTRKYCPSIRISVVSYMLDMMIFST
jgi:hypothetical protein